MPDLDLTWSGDLALTASGDLATVDGRDLTTQRIIRRLMTAVRGYIWHLSYGVGVPQQIGKTLDTDQLRGLIHSNMLSEDTVRRAPAPRIRVDPILNGVYVQIEYVDKVNGRQLKLSFDVVN